jgi:hypothetical protein
MDDDLGRAHLVFSRDAELSGKSTNNRVGPAVGTKRTCGALGNDVRSRRQTDLIFDLRSLSKMVESRCGAVALGSNISVFRLFRLAVP